jgi:hypothetical protein
MKQHLTKGVFWCSFVYPAHNERVSVRLENSEKISRFLSPSIRRLPWRSVMLIFYRPPPGPAFSACSRSPASNHLKVHSAVSEPSKIMTSRFHTALFLPLATTVRKVIPSVCNLSFGQCEYWNQHLMTGNCPNQSFVFCCQRFEFKILCMFCILIGCYLNVLKKWAYFVVKEQIICKINKFTGNKQKSLCFRVCSF